MSAPVVLANFFGISNYRDPQETELLEYAAIEYLKWAFISIGGFGDAKLNGPSNYDLLFREDDTTFRGVRSNWLYENNLSGNYTPISISGVYINNVLSTTGYTINYTDGKVLFNSPVASGSTVRVEHSYRTPSIYKIGDWFKEVQFNTSPTNSEFTETKKGIYTLLSKNRIQLPAVVVYVPPEVPKFKQAYEIGNRTYYHEQNTHFYIMSDNLTDLNKIHDVLIKQKPIAYWGLDKKSLLQAEKNPLNYDGTLNTSGLMYPDLVTQYPWKRVDVTNNRSNLLVSIPGFHMGKVMWDTNVLVN